MSGPYLPTTGEIPTEVTVIRDGDEVLVCGVRLSEEQARAVAGRLNGVLMQIRVEREQAERQAREERRRREWADGAVAVATLYNGTMLRLMPTGQVQASGLVRYGDMRTAIVGSTPPSPPSNTTLVRYGDMRTAIVALLTACPEPRRLWWLGSRGMMHLDGCGCCIGRSLSDARLLPVDEAPPKLCKRSARKLAEVTP